jgi:oligopeptidase B
VNFKLCVTSILKPSAENWVEVLPVSDRLYIEDVDVHSTFWAISGREDGYENVWLVVMNPYTDFKSLSSSSRSLDLIKIPPRDSVYILSPGKNECYDTDSFRFIYESPTTPPLVCDYCINGNQDGNGVEYNPIISKTTTPIPPNVNIKVLKQKIVPNVDLSRYTTARVLAPTGDGKLVPISILYKPSMHQMNDSYGTNDCPYTSPAPILLYAYGAYGISWDPSFSPLDFSLCDRGVVFAIAHVRGGGEMGREWYYDGKLMKKKNSFSDYITCAEHLIKTGWTSSGKIVCEGGSAGGLLACVVANERPDLFAGVLAGVPFVDGIVTMADASIPLVSTEWDEWGNPNEPEAYEYIRSYSPMENVKEQEYPRILINAGLFDYRVCYWEPTKFVQRVREKNKGDKEILYKIELEEGHTGAMDRYKRFRDRAFDLCFIFECLGVEI